MGGGGEVDAKLIPQCKLWSAGFPALRWSQGGACAIGWSYIWGQLKEHGLKSTSWYILCNTAFYWNNFISKPVLVTWILYYNVTYFDCFTCGNFWSKFDYPNNNAINAGIKLSV